MNKSHKKWLKSFGHITDKHIEFDPIFAEMENFKGILKSLGYIHYYYPSFNESVWSSTSDVFMKTNANGEIMGFSFDNRHGLFSNIISHTKRKEKKFGDGNITNANYGIIEVTKIPTDTSLADIEKAIDDVAHGLIEGKYKWQDKFDIDELKDAHYAMQ